MAQDTTIDSPEQVMAHAKASTLISPRFYTTDYDAMNRIDVSPMRAEWDAHMLEYAGDNNHTTSSAPATSSPRCTTSIRRCARSSWTSS
jgi:hypothetical protein